MRLTSSAFDSDEVIPTRYACDGKNVSPPLAWEGVPREAKSLVLILHDPDAPKVGGFTHWVVYNIPLETDHIEEHVPQQALVKGLGLQATNDGDRIGYLGPCPPSGTHRYFFRLFALDRALDLKTGSSATNVKAAMDGHIIDQAVLMGTYSKVSERVA
jgi:Raf kinase inhibitor-like YbhB/YbcL family protein